MEFSPAAFHFPYPFAKDYHGISLGDEKVVASYLVLLCIPQNKLHQ